MDDTILAMYCRCTDFLKALPQTEDHQQKLTAAAVLTTALVAVWCCGGNFAPARALLGTGQSRPTLRSRRRCNRRLYQREARLVGLVALLGQIWQELHVASVYSIDSFPGVACDTDRLPRAKISQREVSRG